MNCDKMPNPSGNTAVWHLPANTTKKAVYEKYRDYCTEAGLPEVTDSTLSMLWNTDFSHVKIPSKGRFKQCDT